MGVCMRSLLLWLVLVVVGFLIGFVPQYVKAHAAQERANQCEATVRLDQVRQYGSLAYITATQLNYGTAAGYAQQFFDQAQKLASSTDDSRVKGMLTNVLTERDKITTALAKGDAGVVGELQPLLLKLEQPAQ